MTENNSYIGNVDGTTRNNNNNSTVMEQIQQIVGQFPTSSKGKAMIDGTSN